MADTEKKNQDTMTATQNAAPVATPKSRERTVLTDVDLPKTSKGEKIYNWVVYSGINYWINLIISLVIADEVTHGRGKEMLQKTAKVIGNGNRKTVHNARVGLEQLALNVGGWVLLIPMKIAEDHKRSIVYKLNKKLGVDQTAPDGRQLTEQEIHIEKDQPKQSWLRVVGRRALASAAIVVAGLAFDRGFQETTDSPADDKGAHHIGGKQRFTDGVIKYSNRALNSGLIPGGKALAEKEWVQRYLSLAALDVINTKITAMVMHVTNGAKKVHTLKNVAVTIPESDNSRMPTTPEESQTEISHAIKITTTAGKPFVDRIKTDSSTTLQVGA